nr:MAG TPA: hypothetical protein [Caudoviricetes sp.]
MWPYPPTLESRIITSGRQYRYRPHPARRAAR